MMMTPVAKEMTTTMQIRHQHLKNGMLFFKRSYLP
jgi:hypothetical protein